MRSSCQGLEQCDQRLVLSAVSAMHKVIKIFIDGFTGLQYGAKIATSCVRKPLLIKLCDEASS